tara:strand:- start:71 stop:310 length:240 start_codon:yes stop_codon:yes gene_type:complete
VYSHRKVIPLFFNVYASAKIGKKVDFFTKTINIDYLLINIFTGIVSPLPQNPEFSPGTVARHYPEKPQLAWQLLLNHPN